MSKVFMQGNQAMAESAIRAGCKLFFGYPITPSSEVPEYYAKVMRERPEENITFIQAETEVAAFNMVAGAAATGHRAMTATSGPGFSLGQEAMSYMSAADLPAVVIEIMRAGPADGEILAAQGDYFQAVKGGGHGDYRSIVIAPSSIQETVDMMPHAFDLADNYRMPVIILADGLIGQMMEPVELHMNPNPVMPEKPWAAQGWDPKGTRPRAVINSLYIETEDLDTLMTRLNARYDVIREKEVMVEKYHTDGAEYILCAYGTVARVCKAAVRILEENGVKAGLVRPITLWPFPTKEVREVFAQESVKAGLTVEISNGQMVEDIRLAVNGIKPVEYMGKGGSIIPAAEDIAERIMQMRRA